MNQILSVKLEQNDKKSNKKWFKFQFVFSSIVLTVLVGSGFFYFYQLKQKENLSNQLLANYDLYKIYSSQENTFSQKDNNGFFGIIQIPKISLYYPVFSHLTEELLKTAPCKFYGDNFDKKGNVCIAGHNYDNSLFFSKISSLLPNDEIYVWDNDSQKYLYVVEEIYEVEENDLSPIFNYNSNEHILTLVTCNNLNSNRIILKAKQKKLL